MYALKGNAFSSMDGRFGEVVQLEVRHGFQGGYSLTQGAETLAFPPLIQVPIDKFPTVLDIFDVAATPSFLAIKKGQVYFEVRASAGSSRGSTADCRRRPLLHGRTSAFARRPGVKIPISGIKFTSSTLKSSLPEEVSSAIENPTSREVSLALHSPTS